MTVPLLAMQSLGYILAGRFVIARSRGTLRETLFAVLNVAGYYCFFVNGEGSRPTHIFLIYAGLVVVQYAALRHFGGGRNWRPAVAFFTPILLLIVVRYLPLSYLAHWSVGLRSALEQNPRFSYAPYFVGISYLAFRNSYLALEVRNGTVEMPGFWRYLGYSFFVPTMPVGPINFYSNYHRGFAADRPVIPVCRAVLRVLVGLVKYQFLGTILNQLSYSGLLLDRYNHHWIDLPIAILFYYLYLYCNFSGFCDVAIGAAGLLGIPVLENFDHPFAARNVKDFWNRWHITLSQYMRDVLFSPLSKFMVRLFGPAHANHAIAISIVVVFLLVGVWHGVGWNFAAFGAVHALGVVVNHYYTIGLKKWLGREAFKAYNANRWIHAGAVALTFCYCAASLVFFANSFADIHEIFASLK
jgi:D-alanyl-lipoteichoic acid acyltransferase DltB (MBOAT superfamily)